MAPQTLAHKRRIAAALKRYHACAKKHGCGKSAVAKKRPVGRPRKTVTVRKRPVGRPRKRVMVKKRGRPLGSKNKPTKFYV